MKTFTSILLKRLRKRLGLLGFLICTVGCLSISSSPASILIQSTNIPTQATDWSESLDFNLFDPLLGTLTSITYTVEVSLMGGINIENIDPNEQNTMTYTYGADFQLFRPGTNTVLLSTMPTTMGSIMLDQFDGNVDFSGASGIMMPLSLSSTNSFTTVNLADLLLFQGLGSIFMDFDATGLSLVLGAIGKDDPVFQIFSDGGAAVTLTYNYIPEPDTFILFGLASFLLFYRKKIRSGRQTKL